MTDRVQSENAELLQAAAEAEKPRVDYERARAEAVPNVTVAGGFSKSYVEATTGALVSVELPVPIWD